MTWLVTLPIVLPLIGAGFALALARYRRLQGIVSVTTLSVVLVTAVVLLVRVDDGPIVLDVGGWAAPVGIALVADRLAALMLVISVTVTLGVLVYSLAQGLADGDEGAPVVIYHPTFLILSAGVSNAFLAGDLFNLYVGFEILLAASFVLITLSGTRERIRSGTIYVVVSLISSVVFLIAIALIYAATGTVNMAQLALRLPEVGSGTQLVLQLMLLVAFGIKAAMFPLSAWLPDSYPTAPAPVTAVFAGLLTKVGVYAVIRTQVLLFPDGRLNDLLLWVALATMIIGILGAVAQEDIKRLLSFTLVSHIGFMIWGIATGTVAGLSAAIFYVAHHITVQTSLFLVAGLIERRGGTTSLVRLGSLARLAPLLAVLFFVPAMNLAGIPPMTGFLGKVGLVEAAAQQGTAMSWALIAGGLLTSLLTLYAITKTWNMAFWQEAPEPLPEATMPRAMVGSAGALVVFSLVLAALAGPLFTYTDQAAEDLRARTPYINSVLPEGGRGTGQSPEVAEEGERGAVEDAPPAPGAPAVPGSPVPGAAAGPATAPGGAA
ncbi:Na+/H+ antiporter subunit D [Georgenia yuyongxinii]|uniref:Na+/H+ antiporter subunit D n=1 Tax=Georgenia yuyongxinii TaxID=2589797 RepID=A0A5B8CAD6_9MICO|nr:Na+/H+ antiporter subunit D [Georgenia yuyongxinii]QDC26192.1 Na+/H+ antiporter subunit D [Georgenia yuyongxinii]